MKKKKKKMMMIMMMKGQVEADEKKEVFESNEQDKESFGRNGRKNRSNSIHCDTKRDRENLQSRAVVS